MPYRNMAALSVPSTVAIPTCNHCGNEWIDEQTAEALDTALESVYANELHKRLVAFVDTILSTTKVSQRKLEQLLGVSEGYLSKLRGRRSDPSAQVVSTLALLAHDPKLRLEELGDLWAPQQPLTAA